ncbi:MAG: aldo/keto reductase [Pseudorhodobacter sp.]|nr:aldo/keto reductase [Pseudorhodobacter sp.]
MKMHRLGQSGLQVSELCLGCMSFGDPARGGHPWTLPRDASEPLIKAAVEAGITFFDSANVYSDGSSEEILGDYLWTVARRDEIVLATKVHGTMLAEPQMRGLSRRSILHNIDASLRRLKTDHVDLYQIHRWDNDTPIEETMGALHDVVRMGKARYIGASTMWAWQFAKAQQVARTHGWTPFVSMQNQINLLYREEEREMVPLCLDEGVGMIPWSPIARGRLARPAGAETDRTRQDAYGRFLFDKTAEADAAVIGAVQALAGQLGCPMAHVALAWLRQKPGMTAPIIGVTKAAQLDEAVAGLSLTLTPEQVALLEAPYLPHVALGQE